MINQYGADAVRWFIMSDSPPEKDIQWSDTGVAAANKFLQKIWDLNHSTLQRVSKKTDPNLENKFELKVNDFGYKIDQSINQFRFNVSIALFYETFNFIKSNIDKDISNKIFKDCVIKLIKLMLPFVPQFSE